MSLRFRPPQKIRLSNVSHMLVTLYSPDFVPNNFEREFLSNSQTPRVLKLEHKMKSIPNDRLRWTIIPYTNKLSLAVMRNRHKRRWTAAFAEALRRNGFDYHGRKLSTSPDQGHEMRMTGTLEIRLLGSTLEGDQSLENMIHHSGKVVQGLEGFLARNGGRSGPRNSQR